MSKRNKIKLGYFYGLASEKPLTALSHYRISEMCKDLSCIKKEFSRDKKEKFIGNNAKPTYYRLVIEKVCD